jgi:type IV fimbrial biogenesis protein FimT
MLVRRATPASGFTLIEMAVTMAIFAIMVALGIPAMRTWVSDTKVRAVTDALQNGLRQAQAESLRRSRQVVFALTNTTTPNNYPVAAVANGLSWVAWTLPSMTDGTETPQFIASGILSSTSTNVLINSHSTAAICFNSVGRLVNNTTTVTAVTGGANCVTPTGAPPVQKFDVTLTGADRPLEVQVGLGGQVHMCDPAMALSSANPEGC